MDRSLEGKDSPDCTSSSPAPGAGKPSVFPRGLEGSEASQGLFSLPVGLICSLAVHGGLLLFVTLVAPAASDVAPPKDKATVVDFNVVEKPAPPPPKPAEPPPPPEEPKAPAVEAPPPPPEPEKPAPATPKKPKARKKPQLPPKTVTVDNPQPPSPVPPSDLPPPPNQTPPQDAPKRAPVRIGISMSSTSSAGSFAAAVGNTLYGASPTVASDPSTVRPYAPEATRAAPPAYGEAGEYVPPSRVTRLPKVKGEARAEYPEEARRAGIEGQVVLKIRVSDKGKVVEAKVVESAGHGFDEAALKAVKNFTFSPGMKDGRPVATDITYTYSFLLD